ncbi:ABC transporter permease subunit [Haloglomus litoreum]|uniref:ABC transporter permease subunit n=1 Tax=Haloglomus litoreum TaxID=3034026 RepID=UPI0023E77636|nr:ABC transporter permease subunit [Haloglomus sp. DT116]
MTPDTGTRIPTITREDLRQARRSRLLWGALVLVALLVLPAFWSRTSNLRAIEGQPPPAVEGVLLVPGYLSTYLFLVVAALAYGAVAAERESGSVRLLLGLAGTRRDVLVGKLLARVAMLVGVLAALLAAMAGMLALNERVAVVPFLLVGGWVLVYGAAWTAFAVGVSAAFASQYRALVAIAGTYVVLAWNAPVWKAVLEPGLRALLPPGLSPYVSALNPTLSLAVVSRWLVAASTSAPDEVGAGPAAVSGLVLLGIAAVGLLVGARRFGTVDVG